MVISLDNQESNIQQNAIQKSESYFELLAKDKKLMEKNRNQLNERSIFLTKTVLYYLIISNLGWLFYPVILFLSFYTVHLTPNHALFCMIILMQVDVIGYFILGLCLLTYNSGPRQTNARWSGLFLLIDFRCIHLSGLLLQQSLLP